MNDSFYETCADIVGQENLDMNVDPPVCSPPDINSCAELIRCVHARGKFVAVRGGGTYPSPPAGKNQVIISTAAMHSILEVNEQDFILVAGSGVTPDQTLEMTGIAGLNFPLDRLYGYRMTLGGLFMAGNVQPGMPDTKSFIRSVLGIRGVAANGDIVAFGGRTRKNVTGYEITRFLAGSMGLFMLACELIINLRPKPNKQTVIHATFRNGGSAVTAMRNMFRNMTAEPYLMELTAPDGLEQPCYLLMGFSGNRTIVDRYTSDATGILERSGADTVSEIRDDEALKIRREKIREFPFDGMVSCYMSRSATLPFLEKITSSSLSLPLSVYPLDGIVHTSAGNDQFVVDTLRANVRALGGKNPVRWDDIYRNGIGGLLNPSERVFMKRMKTGLDPDGLLNTHIGL